MILLSSKAPSAGTKPTSEDYSTGIVPLKERSGPVTLGLLWLTMVTGFPTVLIGFEWYKCGYTLPQVLQGLLISCLMLLAYGIPATYLGSKSGQTYSLLSRRIFGAWGSRLVSFNLVWISVAWYGLTANFLADGLKGIYHLSIPTCFFGMLLAFAMAFNNFFGFKGIANFARYLAAPLLIAWVGYTFLKASFSCPSTVMLEPSHIAFPQSLTVISAFVIGFGVWGNEADYWRYGKPRVMLSAVPLIASLAIGQIIFPVTGWMMARMSGITDVAGATNLMNQYAFGGFSIIAAAVLVVAYFAINDSGLYGAINGIQNLKTLPRKQTVAGLAITGSMAAFTLALNEHAFQLVATLSSVMLPSATMIMLVEYFWLGKHEGVDYNSVPSFEELPSVRWPAVVSLIIGCAVGFCTSGVLPGLPAVGVCSLQAWLASIFTYIFLRLVFSATSVDQRVMLEQLVVTVTSKID